MKKEIELNIAGEKMVFLFDGENAYDPLFSKEKIINVKARCGHIIDNETLIKILKTKI
jgi:hypothetical protein